MRAITFVLTIAIAGYCFSQAKKTLTPDAYDIWSKIDVTQFASDGSFVSYHLKPGFGDQTLKVTALNGEEMLSYPRGEASNISWDAQYVAFKIVPALDSVRSLKRKKTKKEKMPQDSLGLFKVKDKSLAKFSLIKEFKMPEKASGFIAYRLDEIRPDENDTTKQKSKAKKVSKENGYHLVVMDMERQKADTFKYIINYSFAKEANALIMETKGHDSTFQAGVYHYDLGASTLSALMTGEHTYKQHALSIDGQKAAFLVDTDTTKAQIRDFKLMYWEAGMETALEKASTDALSNDWIVSEHGKVAFTQKGDRIFFGTSPKPFMKDTTLLEDEIIQVEVWNYKDNRLMTQQEKQKEDDLKKSYLAAFDISTGRISQIADEKVSTVVFPNPNKKQATRVLLTDNMKYYREVSWEGFPQRQDLYYYDFNSNERKLVDGGSRSIGYISLGARYIHWYNMVDTAWYAYNIATGDKKNISANIPTSMADERDDHPDYPRPYRSGGWTKDDDYMLLYDRYDIWKVDPSTGSNPINLTKGRDSKTRYRIVNLDKDDPVVDLKKAIVHAFNEETKAEGYGVLNDEGNVKMLYEGDFAVDDIQKAENSDDIIFTKSTHIDFPDLQASTLSFKKVKKITDANPQQSDYKWSTVELMNWTSLQGDQLEGLLYKPDDFDPKKKYPMIVYFYERNVHNLHNYHGAFPHRSIIRPAYYANRGYIVFIPDIVYYDGYPGKSCYDAVIPGVTKLIGEGFIDEKRIGLQGHSWGGYQAAYLITQTDLFACAESGAPVVNMTSAYGGIRWRNGLSRMFQYEHSQSRIGGTLWEYPRRYIENSPLFYIEKINTPVLIMHNDKDGAVPWYQGIEFFAAMRRLDKPAWMLNYNGEPHWPTKRENIKDFQIRMQQFFDHYLMDQPMPGWMEKGIPATEKGYNKGY